MSKPISTNEQQRRTLLVVLILNALLFLGLGVGGILADSSALLANAVDNADLAVALIDHPRQVREMRPDLGALFGKDVMGRGALADLQPKGPQRIVVIAHISHGQEIAILRIEDEK
ncbi:hypothetical protein [Phenylobacterium sp.]|uniref:hypothetical protein n=1 Tax=Phenylobacterium sp. TaxID=1871053 RepID=UPI0040351F65